MNKTIDNFSFQFRVQCKGKDIYQGEMEEMLLNYLLFINIFHFSYRFQKKDKERERKTERKREGVRQSETV